MSEVGSIHKRPDIKKRFGHMSWDEKVAQHFKAHGMPKVAKQVVEGHEVYIGVSDEKLFDEAEYPSGYYNTAFAIRRGKMTPIQILHFDGNHDPDLTEAAKMTGRVNRTIQAAMEAIKLGQEGGLYEK